MGVRRLLAVALVILVSLTAGSVVAGAATDDRGAGIESGLTHFNGFTRETLDLTVTVPNETGNGAGAEKCVILGDLYKPSGAGPRHRVPVILTTNAFGGSKADQAPFAKVAAHHGYGVLAYSGLGFGGSGCKVSVDNPAYDGRAGSQLISFLGGKPGMARTPTGAAYPAINWTVHDRLNHLGRHSKYDPRVGMFGGSFGGQIQFAVADVDPRLDAIVPLITWNDLSYSLSPNNTGFRHGVTYNDDAPGTASLQWLAPLLADCDKTLGRACTAYTQLIGNTDFTANVFHFFRKSSVESYVSHIRIPTLLIQGQDDSLFNLSEAAATYHSLRQHHTTVKMIWQSWGHNIGVPQPGEYVDGPGLADTYEGQRIFNWFGRYLKNQPVDTGPQFAYYRDWTTDSRYSPDTAQYATSSHYPVGQDLTFYASGHSALVHDRANIKPGTVYYANLEGPTALSSATPAPTPPGSTLGGTIYRPTDRPGSFVDWRSAPLKQRMDVVGIPHATLHITTPLADPALPLTELQCFVKIYDVAPNGTLDLVRGLVSPVRVHNDQQAIHVQLPGIVHRFAAGHRIELVIAATDQAYRSANLIQPATARTSQKAPISLTIPVVQ